MSAQRRAIVAAVAIVGFAVAMWFLALPAEQGDCPAVNPPAAVPGPPVVAGR